MLFTLTLYLALVLCALGLSWRVWLWLSLAVGPEARAFTPAQRLAWAARGLGSLMRGPRLGRTLAALLREGLFQGRSRALDRRAWLAHQGMFWGFSFLLVFHALERFTSVRLITDYASTLAPWLILRNLAGLAALAGVGLALHRRLTIPGLRRISRGVDRLAIALLAIIMLSGFALEAAKITSPERFAQMVQSYSTADQRELAGLKALWAAEYGVVFPQTPPAGAELLELGRQVNAQDCASCHDRPQWAFLSYGLSRPLAAVGLAGAAGLERVLWHVHFLACFLGLALLPWTKFLHLFTAPLRLAVKAALEHAEPHPANRATLRAMELDACTHCGACSLHCSVGLVISQTPNLDILPSEKLASLKALARGGLTDPKRLANLRDGAYVCTMCLRCTRLCPSGINLQELWQALKSDLAQAGLGPSVPAVRDHCREAAVASRSQPVLRPGPSRFRDGLRLSAQAATFANCFRCMTCSNACPLVRALPQPLSQLDLLPHQIMHALGMGLREEALGAAMTWHCLTCYQCQEACPQGVRVTDVLCELRNLAAAQVREERG